MRKKSILTVKIYEINRLLTVLNNIMYLEYKYKVNGLSNKNKVMNMLKIILSIFEKVRTFTPRTPVEEHRDKASPQHQHLIRVERVKVRAK